MSDDRTEKKEAAMRLAAMGVSEHVVAAAFQLPLSDVKTLYAQRVEHSRQLSPEDKQLAEAMRGLVWRAYEEAMRILEYGHPDKKDALVRLILQRSLGLVGMESTERFDELRSAFDTMLTEVRTLPEATVHVEARPAALDTYDPN